MNAAIPSTSNELYARRELGSPSNSDAVQGEVHVPLLFENEDGMVHGNDWASGFMCGMHMRHDGWAGLVNDEEHGGCLILMMMLHDEDREMRPEPISP